MLGVKRWCPSVRDKWREWLSTREGQQDKAGFPGSSSSCRTGTSKLQASSKLKALVLEKRGCDGKKVAANNLATKEVSDQVQAKEKSGRGKADREGEMKGSNYVRNRSRQAMGSDSAMFRTGWGAREGDGAGWWTDGGAEGMRANAGP